MQGATGGSVDVHGVGVNTHKAEQVQHVAGATPGYSQIQIGNTSVPRLTVFIWRFSVRLVAQSTKTTK